jgi:hypothetical protein
VGKHSELNYIIIISSSSSSGCGVAALVAASEIVM